MYPVTDLFGEALRHHQLGNMALAEPLYRQLLDSNPNHADAHHLLGVLYFQTGRHELAAAAVRRALVLTPWIANYHSTLGLALQGLGQLEDAVAAFQQSLQIQPDFADAHSNLADVLRMQGRLEESAAHCRQALRTRPDLAQAHGNLGNALLGLERLDEAVECFRRALRLNPHMVVVHNSLGSALELQHKIEEAIRCFQQAARLDPHYAVAHTNLGLLLQRHGMIEEAIASYRQALQLEPDNLTALGGLVHELQHICMWDGLADLSRKVIQGMEKTSASANPVSLPPFMFLTLPTPTTAAQQQKCAQARVHQLLQNSQTQNGPRSVPATLCSRHTPCAVSPKITIGYLSANFRVHPVAFLIVEVLENHDRERFIVKAYSYGRDDASPIKQRIVKACDQFHDIRDVSHAEAARQIQAGEVDILIDLTGYTEESRTQILMYRAAPVQVNYLGFPGTMAAPFLDYILVDDFVVPPDQQPFFTESLVHLPGSYQANDSQRTVSEKLPARSECGLPDDGFVFCCFNNIFKITQEMFGVWMELLQAVPGSVLWLLESNRHAPGNLRKEAAARGVAPERLVFAPPVPLPDHLARHRLADLFVDTFPYNAHTTASDALWIGCPLVTLAGETFATRVAGSLLRTVGLPELVTHNAVEYRKTALRLARDREWLATVRQRLAANRTTSRLFDGRRFARGLEKAYETMWQRHCAGEKPRGFAVEGDANCV